MIEKGIIIKIKYEKVYIKRLIQCFFNEIQTLMIIIY